MTSITSKSTKAEILAAYQALQAQPTTWADAWALLTSTSRTVIREAIALAQDTYQAGVIARQWVSDVVDSLSQPVLKKQ